MSTFVEGNSTVNSTEHLDMKFLGVTQYLVMLFAHETNICV